MSPTLHQISYNNVMDVSKSWDDIKLVKGYEDDFGTMIFLKLLELAPETRKVLKLEDGEGWKTSPQFFFLSRVMFDMIDCAVGFLGPDLDPLEEDLIDLGKRHVGYGVQPTFFPFMGEAVVFGLKKFLGEKLTDSQIDSWVVVYGFMTEKMTQGIKEKEAEAVNKGSIA